MNPQWSLKDGALSQRNEYVSAYLCNPAEWTDYKTDDALYAVGSPSVEMYMDAYNQWGGYASGRGPQSYKFVDGAKGYSVGVNESYYMDGNYQNGNSINAGPNNIFMNSGDWSLASPSKYNGTSLVLYITKANGGQIGAQYANLIGVCPIVALKH